MLKRTGEVVKEFLGRRIRLDRVWVQQVNGDTFPYEVATVSHAVAVLAVTSLGKVVLVKNYRVAADEIVLEVPAGKLEAGDDTDEARLIRAQKELKEETGYTADTWKSRGYVYTSPGITNERIYLFDATGLKAGATEREASEVGMEVVEVPIDEIRRMLRANEIKDAKTGMLLCSIFN